MQAAEVLAVLVAMGLLSFRYASRPPSTVLEIVSLLAAVAGLGGEVAFDPIIWPGVAGVLMLALPLLVNRRTLGAKAGAC